MLCIYKFRKAGEFPKNWKLGKEKYVMPKPYILIDQ